MDLVSVVGDEGTDGAMPAPQNFWARPAPGDEINKSLAWHFWHGAL